MTNRFTENARRVLADAARTAGELGHAHIGSEHILLAITLDGESTAMRVLRGEGITSDGVRRRLIALLGMGRRCAKSCCWIPRCAAGASDTASSAASIC